MPQDGIVGGRGGEGNLGQSGIQALDADNSILLLIKTKCAEEADDFDIRVGGPDSDVVSVLVCHSRTFDVEFNMDAVTIVVRLEQFADDGDRGREGVLDIVNALGLGECACRKLAWTRG